MFSRLLRESETQQVHAASLEILDRVGIEVSYASARDIYRRHGGRVDDETLRVTLPPRIVGEFIDALPHRFTFRAQDPAYDRTIPDDAPLTITASSAPHIIDPVSGDLRRATSDDIARAARLVDRLPGVDLFSVSVLADDARVFDDPVNRSTSDSSKRPIVFGYTIDDRYIAVIYEKIDEDTVYPVTAFEVPEPS